MTNETAEYGVMKGQIDRTLALSASILEKLRSGCALSIVLSDVSLLARLCGDKMMECLMSRMTYGAMDADRIGCRTRDKNDEAAHLLYGEIFKVSDARALNFDHIGDKRRLPQKDSVLTGSVFMLEGIESPKEPSLHPSNQQASIRRIDLFATGKFAYDETQRVLNNARNYVHKWVAEAWEDANRNLEALELLGPDYRFVLDSLSALDTKVGDILKAVVDHLRSNNPEHWKLAVLGCRNCLIKLSDILWRVDQPTYHSTLDGKTLETKRDREKNRLLAYTDVRHKSLSDNDKASLREARDLIHPIYDEGSKGKRFMTMQGARKVVRDTFHLCHLLYQTTNFEPVTDSEVLGEG